LTISFFFPAKAWLVGVGADILKAKYNELEKLNEDLQKHTAWVEKAAKNAPAGSDVAVTALKSTVAATTAAFDQLSKATKQVVSFADASMRAATANVATAAKATTKGRKAA